MGFIIFINKTCMGTVGLSNLIDDEEEGKSTIIGVCKSNISLVCRNIYFDHLNLRNYVKLCYVKIRFLLWKNTLVDEGF